MAIENHLALAYCGANILNFAPQGRQLFEKDRLDSTSDKGGTRVPVRDRLVGPQLLGLAPDEAAIAEAMPQARIVFPELSRLLGEQPFFAGEALSLADMMLGPQLDFFSAAPEWAELTASASNLAGWLERMRARPSIQATTWRRVEAAAEAA